MNTTKLINYFTEKQGQYLILPSETKIKLLRVDVAAFTMRLVFTYSTESLIIDIDMLHSGFTTMNIPQGLYATTTTELHSTQSISTKLHLVLEEWARKVRNDEIFGLKWEG